MGHPGVTSRLSFKPPRVGYTTPQAKIYSPRPPHSCISSGKLVFTLILIGPLTPYNGSHSTPLAALDIPGESTQGNASLPRSPAIYQCLSQFLLANVNDTVTPSCTGCLYGIPFTSFLPIRLYVYKIPLPASLKHHISMILYVIFLSTRAQHYRSGMTDSVSISHFV